MGLDKGMTEECPHCHVKLRRKFTTCPACEKRIDWRFHFSPQHTGDEIIRTPCPHCGRKATFGRSPCPHCNQEIVWSKNEEQPKVTPLPAGEDAVVLKQPVYALMAKTGTMHVGNKEVVKYGNDAGRVYFWPVCGNHTQGMAGLWMEFDELMADSKLCGRCSQIAGGRADVFDNFKYDDLFQTMHAMIVLRLGPQIPGVRFDDVALFYNVPRDKMTCRFRDKELEITGNIVGRCVNKARGLYTALQEHVEKESDGMKAIALTCKGETVGHYTPQQFNGIPKDQMVGKLLSMLIVEKVEMEFV